MDQSNVTTRQQKKNGKGKETEQSQTPAVPQTPAAAESSAEKPASQSAFLAGFSPEQAQSLTTYVADAITKVIEPMDDRMDKRFANLQTMMEKMLSPRGENLATQASSMPAFSDGKAQDPRTPNNKHMAAASTPSAGEKLTKSGGVLNDFSTGTPRQPSQWPNVKLESTPQPHQPAAQRYDSIFGGIPAQSDASSQMRWRPEELGSFDPKSDDIYTFADRIREVAEIRNPRLVQLNLSLQLRGKAKRWFELELNHADKALLYDPANGVSAWINALINRFKPSGTELLQKLHNTSYSRADAAAKKDPIEYVHDVIALTRNRPLDESLMEAYLRFESGLQVNLVPPDENTTVYDFMEQVNAKKNAWFTVYATFKQKDQTANQTANQTSAWRSQRPQSNGYSASNNYSANASNASNAPVGNSPYSTAGTSASGPIAQRYPQQPKAYHVEIQPEDDNDEDQDWDHVNY